MIDVNFRDYLYYPALRTREAEMKGFKQLSEEEKSKIIPLFTLHPWPRADFLMSINVVKDSVGDNLCFLDLPEFDEVKKKCNENPSLLAQYGHLTSPDNNFKNWVEILTPYKNIIPIIQTKNSTINQTSKQVKEFLKHKQRIGFRIKEDQDIVKVIAALSQLDDDISNIIVFIDEGFISRATLANKITHSVKVIEELTSEFKELTMCLLSTSFPISPSTEIQNKDSGEIEILEFELFSQVGFHHSNILYGDYASIHAQIYDEQRFSGIAAPRIDYPLIYSWDVRRQKPIDGDRASAYQSIAKLLLSDYPSMTNSNCWGEKKIIDAANGSVFGKSPAQWISVRVNIHLRNQISSSDSFFTEEIDELYASDE